MGREDSISNYSSPGRIGSPMDAINPATGERVGTYESHSERDVDEALDAATRAFGGVGESRYGRELAEAGV